MVEILATIGWFAICFLAGSLAGEFGRWLAASLALAASEAVTLGITIGLFGGVILSWLCQMFREID